MVAYISSISVLQWSPYSTSRQQYPFFYLHEFLQKQTKEPANGTWGMWGLVVNQFTFTLWRDGTSILTYDIKVGVTPKFDQYVMNTDRHISKR